LKAVSLLLQVIGQTFPGQITLVVQPPIMDCRDIHCLSAIAGYQTYDASVLSFDFVPETDTLRIRYVFGSEDYNEWVGHSYKDIFACFITGPNPSGGYYVDKNIAIIPDTTNTPITINAVNNGYTSLPASPQQGHA
jgi:hypothetical protein